MKDEFAGCGGSYGSGAAAMKLQTELDLRSGALSHVEIEPGCSPDGASSRQDRGGAAKVRCGLPTWDISMWRYLQR